MQKRILMPNGSFKNYEGSVQKVKTKTEKEVMAERQKVEEIADKHGYEVTNSAEGQLTKEDIALLKKRELNLAGVISLANNRKIDIPSDLEDKDEVINFLLNDHKENSEMPDLEGKSIPEMRAIAKEKGIKIPGTVKKKDLMKRFLEEYSATDEL